MTVELAVVLHVGSISDLTLLDYLSRVLLHLVAVGGLALLVWWLMGFERLARTR